MVENSDRSLPNSEPDRLYCDYVLICTLEIDRIKIMTTRIQVDISFDSLIASIKSLDLSQKHQLLEILEDQIFEDEVELEEDPRIIAEIEDARQAYQRGDYQTIQDYMATQLDKTT